MKYLIPLLLLICATPALAQDDCGRGVPCGPIPWDLPEVPDLESPTPFPTSEVLVSATPSATTGPSPTPPPTFTPSITPTATPALNLTSINDSMLTMNAQINATRPGLLDYAGNPAPGQITSSTGTLWSYVKGLADLNFGVFSPLMAFILFMLLWVVGLKLLLLIAPAITVLFGFLRKIVQLILDFVPG